MSVVNINPVIKYSHFQNGQNRKNAISQNFPNRFFSFFDYVNQHLVKELNPRRRVYVAIPKPSRVELKSKTRGEAEVFGCTAPPEKVLVLQHRPDAVGLILIIKCHKPDH